MGIVTTLFSNITNPIAILSCFVVGIVPWLGKALLGIGGSLLKGIFAGKGKKQEEKRAWERYMKMRAERKPGGQYSRGVDPVVQQAIMNTFMNRGMANPYAGGGGVQAQAPPGARLLGGMTREQRTKKRWLGGKEMEV